MTRLIETEEYRKNKLDNLMLHIRKWADPETGGSTGELKLTKLWEDGQWVIKVQDTHPVSTWHMGRTGDYLDKLSDMLDLSDKIKKEKP